jgi:excisionase family DNA binding protein
MKKLHVVHKIDDLCTLFNVSKVTIFAWIKKGKLNAYHVGTRLYFKKSDIDTLLNDPK